MHLLTRHKNAARTLFNLVFINLVVAGIGLVTRVGIANVLGIEGFGRLAFGIAIGTFGLLFVQYGLEKSLVRDLVHFPARFGEILKSSLIVRAFLFFIFVLPLGISSIVFFRLEDESTGIMLVAFAIVVSAFQLNGVYDAWKEMYRHAMFFLIQRFVYFVLIWFVILVPDLRLSLSQVGLFMLAAALFGLLLEYRWALPRINFESAEGTWPSTLFVLRSNILIWVAVLFGHLIVYLSQIVLRIVSGDVALGAFSAAWLFIQLTILLISQVGRIGSEATARFTRPEGSTSQRLRFFVRYVSLMTIIGVLIGMPCILFPELILKIYRPEYSIASETLQILGFYPVVFGPYMAGLQYLISSRMQKTYLAMSVFVGLISVGLNVWLIPLLQSEGAALSVVISGAIASILFVAVSGLHIRRLERTS